MSFTRKIFRKASKAELKELGYPRPNKLAWHRERGVKINAMAIERMSRYGYVSNRKKNRRAKRRTRP